MGQAIAGVAALFDDRGKFSQAAKDVATTYGKKSIAKSRPYFHGPPKKPAHLDGRYEGLGDWMALCQAAIFEIWYHLGEQALKPLRSVAYGFYDWTQANATEVLCRLALDGLQSDIVAQEIAAELPKWRYEQTMRVLDPVAKLATRSHTLRQAFETLVAEASASDVVDCIDMVAACYRADPAWGMEYAEFVRDVMRGRGLEGRTPLEDRQVVEIPPGVDAKEWLQQQKASPDPEIARRRQLEAAALLHQMLPKDQEAAEWLRAERERVKDPGVRSYIDAVMDGVT
jgi:hypothetical protein